MKMPGDDLAVGDWVKVLDKNCPIKIVEVVKLDELPGWFEADDGYTRKTLSVIDVRKKTKEAS